MLDDEYVRSRYPSAEAQYHREADGSREPNGEAKASDDAAWVVYSQNAHDSRVLGAGPTSTEAWISAAKAVAAEQALHQVQDADYDTASKPKQS